MMAAERGASRNTLEAYRRDLVSFEEHLARHGGSAAKATREDVRRFIAKMAARSAASSQARRLSTLRQFFSFLYSEGLRSDDPSSAIEYPHRAQALPKTLSQADVEALIDAAREEARRSAEGIRLLCMLEILYASGLRVSELVTLPFSAARSRDGFLLVKGKGGKERLVPLNSAARAAIRNYLKVWESFVSPAIRSNERYLFPS